METGSTATASAASQSNLWRFPLQCSLEAGRWRASWVGRRISGYQTRYISCGCAENLRASSSRWPFSGETSQRLCSIALRDRPEFSKRFITHLLSRNRRIEGDLVDQLFNSSEKRLARLLLLLAGFGEAGSSRQVRPKISQEVLADMIGTTRSRVSFFMNKFRKLGFISYDRKIEVHSSLMTAVLSEKSEMNRT